MELTSQESGVMRKESVQLVVENKEQRNLTKATNPVTLSWRNVSFSVGDRKILQNLNGIVKEGEVCAVMGPSGSGKTTLMDFISSRIDHRQGRVLEGDVLLNETKCTSTRVFSKYGAYVPQDEALVGTMTTRETLRFAARLTVGGEDANKIDYIVEELITEMGLEVCADTIAGTVFQKGLSGGQKRRLSVAIELIRSPSLLVLDEPTSGLDAASAFAEVSHLKSLAKAGHTIILSIHQPSSEIWDLFDKVGFMSTGENVYFGPAGNKCLDYFKGIGYPCPQYSNPADFVISLINADFPGRTKEEVKGLVEKFAKYQTENKQPRDTTEKPITEKPRPNVFTRLLALTHRNALEMLRDPGILAVRLAMYTMLSLVVGLMYLNLGDDKDFSSIQSRISLLFYVAAFMVFMSVAVLPFFIIQRDVFVKERANGAYEVPEYVLSKFLISIPGVFALALVTTIFVVLLAKLNGFGIYLATLFLSLLVAEGFMAVMAVLVPHYIIGIALAAGVFGFFMLCQGFFIMHDDIPDWFIWGYYIAFHTYSFRVFMYNEFDSVDSFDSELFPTGQSVLHFYSMEDVDIGRDLGILVAYVVFFRLLFMFILWRYHTGKR